MKEIKFRAWNTKKKEMIYQSGDFFAYGDEETYYRSCGWSDMNKGIMSFYECEGILMQFTGLKDKKGEEIYEGDIVKAWSQGVSAIGEVSRRIDGLWIIYPAYQKQTMWGLMPDKDGTTTVEVIGNIWNNPELLEAK